MNIINAILNSDTKSESLSKSIIKTKFDELPILVVKHKTCHASVALQGAHLLFWQPTMTNTPIIWLSENAAFKQGMPIRGGIPICWPWFGKCKEPAHGFARTEKWQLFSINESETGVTITLSLGNTEKINTLFPDPFRLLLSIELGLTCKLELSAWGNVDVTSALHSYFAVDNINNVIINGLGDTYQDKLSTPDLPPHSGTLKIVREIDRIYNQPDKEVTIYDGKRTIKLTSNNTSDIVIWNPWQENAKKMLDMTDDGFKNMVCVETARINKPIKLSPNEKTTYGFKVELI